MGAPNISRATCDLRHITLSRACLTPRPAVCTDITLEGFISMIRTTARCPNCASTVVLDRDYDGLAAVCLGCSRRWEQRPPALVQGERERALIRADPNTGRPGRPRKVLAAVVA